jgi:uncharacterized protein (DUF2336 family)
MHGLAPESLLIGKEEDTRIQIAGRVGDSLSVDELATADRRAAEMLARALADDAIESVRVALSEAIAKAKHLPRDLALKLAHDIDSVACPFLEATEVFSDSDWQQLLLTISRNARISVAQRSNMSAALAKSLSELGDSVVASTLIENPAAPMTEPICYTLMDRFSSEIWVLDKLAWRDDLISEIAIKLTTIVSAAARKKLETTYKLTDFTEPVAADAETGALLQIVKKTPKADLMAISEELHNRGRLKPTLVLRALKEDHLDFLEAALSVLSGRSLVHVRSVILRAALAAVKQLLDKAQIPDAMHEDFWKELEIIRQKHK